MAAPRSSLALVRDVALLAVLYTLLAKLGLALDAVGGFATLVWPPTGLALAALLLRGSRLWPGVWLGAFLVNLWVGASWPVAMAIAVGNTLEALIGAYVLREWTGFRGSFDRLSHVISLLIPVALGSTAVSATIGVASLALGGNVSGDHLVETWRAWWVGDMLGALVVAPLILSWTRPFDGRVTLPRLFECLLLAVAVAAVSLAVFLRPPGATHDNLAAPYMLFPFLIWAGARFELRGAATMNALASGLAVWATTRGMGPFVRERLADSLLALQTFMACAAISPLLVGAAFCERVKAVSDRRLADRFRTVARACRSFAEANPELPGLLNRIAQHVAEALGDASVVRLLTDDGSKVEVVSLHHANPEVRALLRRAFGEHQEEARGFFGNGAIRSGESLFLPVVSREECHACAPLIVRPYVDQLHVCSVMVVPIRDQDRIIGSLTAVRTSRAHPYALEDQSLLEDLSDRAGLAIRNARLHEDLKVALQARDDFLAVASHELKTPLTALLMHLESVRRAVRRATPPARMDERLAKAVGSAMRLERLINQLLDVSRITAGRLRLEPEPLNLSDVAKEVIARFQEAGSAQAAAIRLDAAEDVNGQWDRLRMEQVVTNLLSNAIKYGQGKPVEVSLSREGRAAVLRVQDHGIGVDEEHQKKLFQRFERAVATREFGGFGLGLWITREIVDASGGKVEVESVLGRGSTFTVRLPANPPHVRSAPGA